MAESQTILIVEDELSLLRVLEQKFRQQNFTILTAKDGLEGLTLARTQHPALILIDIIMPKMDGIAMIKEIRGEDGWGKEVPIILLTNLVDTEKADAAAEHNVHDYLVKANWTLDDVVKKVKEKLLMPV